MDNLKKNLHFVVLGGGVLLGIILVVVGIMIRGGTEDQLADAQSALQTKTSVPTKGTLEDLEARSSKFVTSVEAAEEAIKNAKGFESDYPNHTSGDAFYTNEANNKVRTLRERWTRLEGTDKLPSLIKGWTIKRMSGNQNADGFWERLAGEVASPPNERIRDLQRQLRILEEVLITCERLVAAGLDQDMGVRLLSFKADAYQSLVSNATESPWMVMQWDITLECAPGFAVLLFDELTNPSALTLGKSGDIPERRGFPMLPMNLQTEMVERPAELKLDISNDEKAALIQALRDAGFEVPNVPDPKDLDPASPAGKQIADAALELLHGDGQILMPVRAGLRMRAAGYNTNWRAINIPEVD